MHTYIYIYREIHSTYYCILLYMSTRYIESKGVHKFPEAFGPGFVLDFGFPNSNPTGTPTRTRGDTQQHKAISKKLFRRSLAASLPKCDLQVSMQAS